MFRSVRQYILFIIFIFFNCFLLLQQVQLQPQVPNVNELLESSRFSSKCLSCIVVVVVVVVVRLATLIHSIQGACPAAHQISKIIALCTVSADCLQKKAKNEKPKKLKSEQDTKVSRAVFWRLFSCVTLSCNPPAYVCVCCLYMCVYLCLFVLPA